MAVTTVPSSLLLLQYSPSAVVRQGVGMRVTVKKRDCQCAWRVTVSPHCLGSVHEDAAPGSHHCAHGCSTRGCCSSLGHHQLLCFCSATHMKILCFAAAYVDELYLVIAGPNGAQTQSLPDFSSALGALVIAVCHCPRAFCQRWCDAACSLGLGSQFITSTCTVIWRQGPTGALCHSIQILHERPPYLQPLPIGKLRF